MSTSTDSSLLFCNVLRKETGVGVNHLAQGVFVIKSFASTASGVLAFPNITVVRTMSTFGGGQYLTTINSVDKQLFEGFQHVAAAIGLSLTDKAQVPQIVAKLKERSLIDNALYFKILDSLFTFDGLLSQVNQSGKMLVGDFDLMRNVLTMFSRLKLNLSQNTVLAESMEFSSTSDYFNYLTSTFSTSSSTLIQSSNVDLMKSSG